MRELVPYAGPRSAFLQIAIDDLVQQDRLVPGQLAPLLRLTGVQQVLVARDGVVGATARSTCRHRAGPGTDRISGGSSIRPRRVVFRPPRAAACRRPANGVTRLEAPGRLLGVRLAAGPATVLEGDAEGVTELAAPWPARSPPPAVPGRRHRSRELAAESAAGATVALSDSARRRNFISSRTRGNRGPTLTATDP